VRHPTLAQYYHTGDSRATLCLSRRASGTRAPYCSKFEDRSARQVLVQTLMYLAYPATNSPASKPLEDAALPLLGAPGDLYSVLDAKSEYCRCGRKTTTSREPPDRMHGRIRPSGHSHPSPGCSTPRRPTMAAAVCLRLPRITIPSNLQWQVVIRRRDPTRLAQVDRAGGCVLTTNVPSTTEIPRSEQLQGKARARAGQRAAVAASSGPAEGFCGQ
jgi:hypothetical protein